MKGLFITGTDTGVGKTHIGCALARTLTANNIMVVPRKPVESGCVREGDDLIPADALALKQAANYSGNLDLVCPYRFEPAISPDRAARLAGTPINVEQLKSACLKGINQESDFLLVEGAGGFYSPLCTDGLNADLAQALGLPVLLIAEDRLGCINQILLTLEAMQNRGLIPSAIVLNRLDETTDDSKMDNYQDLQELIEFPVIKQSFSDDSINLNWAMRLLDDTDQ